MNERQCLCLVGENGSQYKSFRNKKQPRFKDANEDVHETFDLSRETVSRETVVHDRTAVVTCPTVGSVRSTQGMVSFLSNNSAPTARTPSFDELSVQYNNLIGKNSGTPEMSETALALQSVSQRFRTLRGL